MNRRSFLLALPVLAGAGASTVLIRRSTANAVQPLLAQGSDLRSRFQYLSTHGNSNCSLAFQQSIASMSDSMRLQGSCCSPMDYDKYVKQVTALRSYQGFPEIPSDPYDIPAKLANELLGFDQGITLTAAEQAVLSDAVPRTK